MFRAYKYRIYPTQEQAELINKTIGCARFVYNSLLADCKQQFEQTGHSRVGSYAALKSKYDFLREVDSLALNAAYNNLKTAYKNYFEKTAEKPDFHSKHNSRASYTTNNLPALNNVRLEKGKLRLPKVGLVKIVLHRFCKGTIKSVTISRTKTNKYFASILTEQQPARIEKDITQERVLGIDMSFKEMAVYSDGTKAKYPMYYRKSQRKLAHVQRNFSRTKVGSKNHEKMRLKQARVHEKIANQRRDFLNKESYRISQNYDVVVVEDINMRSIGNHKRHGGKTVYDISFGMFRTMLEYKLAQNLGQLVKADKWFPSSQLCHVCGFKNIKTKDTGIRNWICPECGTFHDRDINAAINLVQCYTAATAEIQGYKPEACGEVLNLSEKLESSLA